jgi:ankyrin repeat protein
MKKRMPGEISPGVVSENAPDLPDGHENIFPGFYSDQLLGQAMLRAAYNDESETIKQLVERHRAPVDSADSRTGVTALHIAVGRNHLNIAKYLVEKGASFLPDNQGRMPTTIAAECEVSDEMCDFIAEAEAKAEGV